MKRKTVARISLIGLLSIVYTFTGYSQKSVAYGNSEYNIGITYEKDDFSVLSKDLVLLKCNYTLLTTINEDNIPFLDDKYGPHYTKNYCIPVVRSTMREVFGSYTVDEILTTKREQITTEISTKISTTFSKENISFENLLIEGIELPTSLQEIYKEVLESQQNVFVEKYNLEKARHVAEIESIKMNTQAKINQMLDTTLTDRALQLKYIDMLSKLSESKNTKIIILGDYKQSLQGIVHK